MDTSIRSQWRKWFSFPIVLSVLLLSACSSTSPHISVPPLKTSDSDIQIDFSDLFQVEKAFFSDDMGAIEGLWVWKNNAYQVAIFRNESNLKPDYDYLGVVTWSNSSTWEAGDVKFLIDESKESRVFTGVYYINGEKQHSSSFRMTGSSSMDIMIPGGPWGKEMKVQLVKGNPDVANGRARVGSQGSCFFVSADGAVVTNYHVVEGQNKFQVIDNSGTRFEAVLVKRDPANDLAVLKVDTRNHNHLNIAPFGTLKTGQDIFAIGYPVSGVLGTEPKFTGGSVSSTAGMNDMANMFQMSVPMQPGNSGGPVLNEKGQVVGIATSTAAIGAFFQITGSLPQNVNWAIKSEYVSLLTGIQGSTASLGTREAAIDAAIGASCMIKAQ